MKSRQRLLIQGKVLARMEIIEGETEDGTMCYFIRNNATGAVYGGKHTQAKYEAQAWLDAYTRGVQDALTELEK